MVIKNEVSFFMYYNGFNNDIGSYMYPNICPSSMHPIGAYPGNTCPLGTQTYSIMPGDTLYSIAIQFSTSIQQIMYYNPGINPYNLRIGQDICIPEGKGKEKNCVGGTLYTIQYGDTLNSISSSTGTTVEALLDLNPEIDPYNLIPGQTICIPLISPITSPTKTCPDGTTTYTVKREDTLTKILVKYDYSYAALLFYNPDVNFDNLTPNTLLCIPDIDEFSGSYCPTEKTYVTRKGDNLIKIAETFDVSTHDLLMLNRSLRPSDFEIPCVRVCIPESDDEKKD